MNPPVTVRKAEMSDINAIIKINRICLPENYSFDFFYRVLNEWGFACVVAELEGKVVGYVLARVEKPLTTFLGLQPQKGHIISIAVLPQYRRMHIGKKIMLLSMKNLVEHECTHIYLEVRKSNKTAILLYENLNYKLKKEIKHYYRDGESALVLEWIGNTVNM